MEVVLYSTVVGGLGALMPFVSRADADFFKDLEIRLRSEQISLTGRDHRAFRSAYVPVKVRCWARRALPLGDQAHHPPSAPPHSGHGGR